MMNTNRLVWLLALLALGALAAETAFAKRGSSRADRVKERVELVEAAGSPLTVREARLKVERRGLSRQTLKIELKAVERGASLEVFMEDETGQFERVGAMRESRAAVYKWRVRMKKGAALPFGVADVADLSGRGVEVRTTAGEPVAGADFPTIAPGATTDEAKRLRIRTGMAVDAAAESVGDDSIDARVEVRRKKDGREEWKVEVDHAPAGLLLEAWMEDGTGAFVRIGALEEELSDRGTEYEIERKSDEGGLPLGARDLSELSGRKVEIRDENGDVLASGFVPAIAAAAAGDASDEAADAEDPKDDESDEDESDSDES
jgi:hypothetical protein